MNQTDRVLLALRSAGRNGVCQADFFLPTIDGGRPITRLAARVRDLRNAGYLIVSDGERHGFTVYTLRVALVERAPGRPPGRSPIPPGVPLGHVPAPAQPEQPRLFDVGSAAA